MGGTWAGVSGTGRPPQLRAETSGDPRGETSGAGRGSERERGPAARADLPGCLPSSAGALGYLRPFPGTQSGGTADPAFGAWPLSRFGGRRPLSSRPRALSLGNRPGAQGHRGRSAHPSAPPSPPELGSSGGWSLEALGPARGPAGPAAQPPGAGAHLWYQFTRISSV